MSESGEGGGSRYSLLPLEDILCEDPIFTCYHDVISPIVKVIVHSPLGKLA